MEFFGELLVEFLTGLADFAERKRPPFGIRYWLGWLGVLIHVLLFALLTCVTVFFFIFLLEGKGLIHGIVAIVFLVVCSILALEMRKNNLENVASNDLLFSYSLETSDLQLVFFLMPSRRKFP
ncbi:TPA: hypothetical protein ACGOVE_000472 [Streptococcus suis]